MSAERLQQLMRHRAQPGRVTWIGIRPARDAPMEALMAAELRTDRGIAGDRAATRRGGKRQVSLIQREHIDVVAAMLGRDSLDPALLRRNLVVEHINLLAFRKRRFTVGRALLEYVDDCAPCSKMERALGQGGYNAMRGHGGILARVLEGTLVSLYDGVDFAPTS